MEGLAISTDVPCVGCGYNLRMQPVEGVCTECGLAVKGSLEQTILKWGWKRLRRIAWGMRIAAATMIAIPLVLAAGIVLDDVILRNHEISEYIGMATFGAMGMIGVGNAAGAWMATSAPRGERQALSRWLCRLGGLTIPLVPFILLIHLILQRADSSSEIGSWLGLAVPMHMVGWAVYAERAAACWTVFHQRGGLAIREGMGKWSMRCFAPVALVLAGGIGTILGLELLRQLNLFDIDWRTRERVIAVLQPIMMGGFGAAVILSVMIIIALFRGGNRAAELARLAAGAEREGFTAPLAVPNSAPSCS
jgi:hypothetical protein